MTLAPPAGSSRQGELENAFRREVKHGLAIALAFFVMLGGWAMLARLDSAVVAPATVVVSGNRQAVQHRDGGIVARIHVAEGQRVDQGELLIELNRTELAARERILVSQVITYEALYARLRAEMQNAAAPVTPPMFATLDAERQAMAGEAMAGQLRQFEARRQSYENERLVLQQRIVQLEAQMEGLRAQVSSQEQQQAIIGEELRDTRQLADDGFAPLNRVRALERSAVAIEGQAGEYRAAIARAQEQIGETRLQIVQIERVRAEEVTRQMQDTELRLSEVRPEWEALVAQLERTNIRAPASGVVVGLQVHTEGGVIAPGSVLMEIVPEARPLVLQARVAPQDVEDLRPGVRVEVRLTAFARSDAPILFGALTRVSADGLTDEATQMTYYLVEVELPREELQRVDPIRTGETDLLPGMPAEVVIPIGRRSALQYALDPLVDTLWRSLREE